MFLIHVPPTLEHVKLVEAESQQMPLKTMPAYSRDMSLVTLPGQVFQLLSILASAAAPTILHLFTYLCVYDYSMTCIWRSEDDLWELALSFHHVGGF